MHTYTTYKNINIQTYIPFITLLLCHTLDQPHMHRNKCGQISEMTLMRSLDDRLLFYSTVLLLSLSLSLLFLFQNRVLCI